MTFSFIGQTRKVINMLILVSIELESIQTAK